MGKTSLRKILVGKTLFHENFWREKFLGKTSWENLSAKLLHQKLLSQKKFLGEKFHGEKLLSGENFHGETFIQKTSTGISSHPQKLSGTEERGTVPEKMEFILDNDDFEDTRDTPPDSIIQRKSPQRLRTLLRLRKTFQAKLIFRKTFWSKLIFQKTSSARRQSPC